MANEKRIVFSTPFVDTMTKKLDDGYQVSRAENPFFMNIQDVRREGISFRMSKEELDHYIKCKLDVNYFANSFCKVKVEDGSYRIIKLRDYQVDILNMFDDNKFSILMASRQVGKCNDLITSVLAYDSSSDTLIEIPLYELYFKYKKDRNLFDKIKYKIYKLIHKLS